MCGINGFLSLTRTTENLGTAVTAMVAATRHRGPDATAQAMICEGAPALVFGHNRLAIIDLSPTGAQPMTDPATGNWLVFNGEIYNFAELRVALQKLGKTFRGRSDTEVILQAYAQWQEACVTRFRGIFAFALWEAKARKLFLARDHLGVKPLYYAATTDGLIFSSEVRGVLASGAVERKLDVDALAGYLRYGSVQEPGSLVHGVASLPPGHGMSWTLQAGLEAPQRYWSPLAAVSDSPPPDAISRLRAELEQAVRLQLVADVPLGVFLSGGIDSSAIASLACRASAQPINTFCIGFEEAAYDESEYARQIAVEIGSRHRELILTAREVRPQLTSVLAAYDQPSADGMNTYFISEVIVKQGMKVALSGLGGDEVFAGYNGFAKPRKLEALAPLLRATAWLPGMLNGGRPAKAAWQGWAEFGEADLSAPYFASRLVYNQRWVRALLANFERLPPSLWRKREQAMVAGTRGLDAVNRLSVLEMQHYMLSTLLRDSDQMSMAHGLELRVPLLDHKLVEQSLALPGAMKLDAARQKPCLLDAMGDALPAISYSHPKQGFVFPLERWFRDELMAPLEEFFLGEAEALPWGRAMRAELWRLFQQGQLGWARLWTIYLVDWWVRAHGVRV